MTPLVNTKEPIAYFEPGRGLYWRRDTSGEYIERSESSVRRVLKYDVYGHILDKESSYIYCDRHLMKLQDECSVSYAGPLAGWRPGLHHVCGRKVLITHGPRLIVPTPGNWPLLKKFLGELLGEQATVVYSWLKASLRTLYAGPPFRPAPMLALAGPKNCGKSLLQNIISEIFGGRSAKPYRYLTMQTAFNSDLLGAEHLMIEDDANQTDIRFRRAFGSQLKNLVFNETQSFHRKTRDAITVSVFSRITISVNDEPENLAVLPPMDESLLDKISLLQAFQATFPYGKDDIKGRNAYRQAITNELPAFLHFLRGWRIPDRMQNQRCGVAAYQDNGLMNELLMMSPEAALLELIDRYCIWNLETGSWTGTSSELKDQLCERDRSGRAAKLLEWHKACGTYLARLKSHYPRRFSAHRIGDIGNKWTILPPASPGAI